MPATVDTVCMAREDGYAYCSATKWKYYKGGLKEQTVIELWRERLLYTRNSKSLQPDLNDPEYLQNVGELCKQMTTLSYIG